MRKNRTTLITMLVLVSIGLATVASADEFALEPRIFLSFDQHTQTRAPEALTPMKAFRFYVLAEGTGPLAAWEAQIVLPRNVVVRERTLAQERAIDVAANLDDWMVGVGECLPAVGKAPLLLATYEAVLLEPAKPGAEIQIVAADRASLGHQPAWADCSMPKLPLRGFSTLDASLVLARGEGSTVAELEAASGLTGLLANTPNPFNPSTRIRFRMGQVGDARIRIFDLAGRLVRTYELSALSAGEHDVTWQGNDDDGDPVASGAYVVRLETPAGVDVRRVALLK